MLLRKLRLFLDRRRFARDLDDEMSFHRAEAQRDLESSGLSPDAARYAARRQFGNSTRLREEAVDIVAFSFEATLQDVRYGARQLRRNPGFTVTAVLVLALGIGATTAIFSAVDPILFRPLPYPRANRLVMIWDGTFGGRADVAFHTFRELRERSRSFDALAALKAWQPTLTRAGQPERFDGQLISAPYFRTLGVAPALGRDFVADDDRFHGPNVVIISDALWKRRFGGDPSTLGRQILLDGQPYTIVGIMPRDFENVLSPSAEVWSPLQFDSGEIANLNTREWGHQLRVVARLRPGVDLDHARAELAAIARHPIAEFPRAFWASLKSGVVVDSLHDEITRAVKPALLAVAGAVALLLLIACVNVTNLLLVRGAQRRGELAMRAALGAARSRLLRQLLTEAVLLALLGGALGIVLADAGVRLLVALSPPDLPRVNAIVVDRYALAFACAITTVVGLLVGLVPALHASRGDLQPAMQRNARTTAGGRQWTRRSLVVAEVALALVLLVSAGLLLRSLQRLFAIDPGFDSTHLLTMQVETSGYKFADAAARLRFLDDAGQAVRAVPGVLDAGLTSLLPLNGDQFGMYGIVFESDRSGFGGDGFRYVVTPGYFESMRIPLRRGRLLNARDTGEAPRVAVISDALAKRAFGSRDPIGQRMHIGPRDKPWYTVVGVVGDVRQSSLALSRTEAVYITAAQTWFDDDAMSLVVRARGDAAALAPAVRNAIWSVDKDQPVLRVATMERLLTLSEAQRRFAMLIFEVFALVALMLAATGMYGVLAGSVAERTREIGVRAALGATRGDILGLIVRQGMTLSLVGVALGVAGAAVATRALVTLLFGISRLDPETYAAVIALLLGVSAIACWVPAWRAARVDPSITLRAE